MLTKVGIHAWVLDPPQLQEENTVIWGTVHQYQTAWLQFER
jgi:hypothetical protein